MQNISSNDDLALNSNLVDDSLEIHSEVESYNISLLEEKLVVKRAKKKVGEVIVRKEIETRTVHIPIRREKLIIEKQGLTDASIDEVELAEGEVNGIRFGHLSNTNDIYQVQSEFVDLQKLRQILDAIGNNAGENVRMRLEIISDRPELQQKYQNICDSL